MSNHICSRPKKLGDHYFCSCDRCYFWNPETDLIEYLGMWEEVLQKERGKISPPPAQQTLLSYYSLPSASRRTQPQGHR